MASIAHIPIEADERLSRFVLKEKWRRQNSAGQIKYEAFLPFSRVELSVTRARGLTEHRLWGAGRCAALKRIRNAAGTHTERIGLYGRFDFLSSVVKDASLQMETAEGPERGPLNHVNITGFPATKAAQQWFAQTLAEAAVLVDAPPNYAIGTAPAKRDTDL